MDADARDSALDADTSAHAPGIPAARTDSGLDIAASAMAILQRENSVHRREDAAYAREIAASLREQSLVAHESAANAEVLASAQIRQANEHLVEAAVHAQTLADAGIFELAE